MDGAEVGAFVGKSVVTTPHTRGRRSSTSAGRIASPLVSVACLATTLDNAEDHPAGIEICSCLFSFDLPKNASSDGDAAAREHGGVVDDDECGGLRA